MAFHLGLAASPGNQDWTCSGTVVNSLRLQFGLQFTAVRHRPGWTDQGCWSSLNGSGRPRSELLMRLGFTPFRGSNPRASAAHRPSPRASGERAVVRDRLSPTIGPVTTLKDSAPTRRTSKL